MFRATLLSIVFSLAGQDPGLLCRIWCESQATECHQENSSTSAVVAGDESCGHALLAVSAILSEDVPRGLASSDAHRTIPVRTHQVDPLTIAEPPPGDLGRLWALEKRPLSSALRI